MLHQIEQTGKMGLVTLSKFLISLSLILCCYSPCTSAQWIGNSFTNVDIATTFPLGHLAELMQTHSPASWGPLSAIVPPCTSSRERAPVPSLGMVLQKCTPSFWKETWNTDFSSGLHCKISFHHCCLIACIILLPDFSYKQECHLILKWNLYPTKVLCEEEELCNCKGREERCYQVGLSGKMRYVFCPQ